MQVRDIMTENPMCANPDTPLQDVAQMMIECDCGGIPICERGTDRLVGFVTDRDIVCRTIAKGLDPLEMIARDAMTSNPQTVRPNVSVDECIQLMERYKVRRAPVVDDQGRLVGIVSQADLVLRAVRQEPEILEEVEEALEEISTPRSAM